MSEALDLTSRGTPAGHGMTVIVGMGKTGLSFARFLRRHGEQFAITDTRREPPGVSALRAEMPGVPAHFGTDGEQLLRRARRLLLSPGVSPREPAVAAAIERGAEVIGDIELFARHADAPVVAITGANGKSTVTTLVGAMAARAGRNVRTGGNLGTPALDLLGGSSPDLYVLELSSFQLETVTSLDAKAAAVLNVSPDHMDRYSTLEEYAAAKRRIYRGTGVMVMNADDAMVMRMAEPARERMMFSLRAPRSDADFGLLGSGGEAWLARGARRLMPAREMRIRGMHNAANALAALALGWAAGLPTEAMLQTLHEFPGLPHRCQWVGGARGVDWFDDSKGTNVGATVAAILGLGTNRPVVLIAGGDGKGQDFSDLAGAARNRLRGAVTIGRDGPAIAAVLQDIVAVTQARDMHDAVARAADMAQPGDAVLLSPACASFDMFRDYVHRGEVFAAAVREQLA
ncbi:MAG: UDP-N-acetylmuramoylalanine--D-glutamate ligase [Gammaproteobacteria bacterium]|nr:UDP-N-acetylmuramoylalanine--D-glutamate ligase [Gammaproteobacteria bacterium]